jgi:cytochrome c oxidase assembly factor CtaG
MSLLISVLITFLVIILVLYLVDRLPIKRRAKEIIRIIVIILGVLSLLRAIVGFPL